MWSYLPFLLVPLTAGALRSPNRLGPRFSATDLWLAAGLGIGVSLLASGVYAKFSLRGSGLITSDFAQYCAVADAARSGAQSNSPQRSYFVGLLLSPLTRLLGVRDGILTGSLLSTGAVAVGIYLWAGAVAGRTAAVWGTLALLAVGPLAVLPHTLSFYPEVCAILALLAGTTAMAMRFRTDFWLTIATIFLAVTPLVDLKTLPWMLGPLLGLFVIAWVDCRWTRGMARTVMIGVLLSGSWWVGPRIWPARMPETLEMQMASYVVDVERHAGIDTGIYEKVHARDLCGYETGTGFRWGSGSPLDIPSTFRCLTKMRALLPATIGLDEKSEAQRSLLIVPWLPMMGFSIPILLLLGRRALHQRDPGRLLALLVPLPPFLFALFAAYEEEPAVRRLSMAFLFLPVLIGITAAMLYRWRSPIAIRQPGEVRPRANRPAPMALAILWIGLICLLTGMVPNRLSPFLQPVMEDDLSREWAMILDGTQQRDQAERSCAAAQAADVAAGTPALSRFADWYGLRVGGGFRY